MRPLFLVFTFLFAFQNFTSAQVVINEYSASNLRKHVDSFGSTEDWVELYNTDSVRVDISGWWLSDKEDNPEKWEIPQGTSLDSNDFLVIYCSSRDGAFNGELHSNFKLTQTKGGETLVLSNSSGIVDIAPVEITLLEHSRCREIDGDDNWTICQNPTFKSSNNISTKYTAYTTAPTMNMEGGFYTDSINLTIAHPNPNITIRYTLDGRTPTPNAPEYTDSTDLMITETTVVKARAFSSDSTVIDGKVAFNTYFINEDFTLEVYSIAADSLQNLANGQGELRPIGSIEYFNLNKEREAISYGELNRHGQDSWVNDHRSIDWVSRDEMGYNKDVQAELFRYSDRDNHQRLMFRASGDDNYPAINDSDHDGSAHIRDEYVHILAQEGGLKLDVRAVERCIVFLNGDYWGVYGLRERPVDHDYTKEYYDQEKFDLQYLLTWGETWAEYGGEEAFDDWTEVRDFILEEDMSDPNNYQFAKDNIQLLGLIDYMITNLNCVSSDWLNYNTGWWRGTNPDGDHKKWGYILWDNDATFDYYINYSGVPNTDPDAQPCDIDDIAEYMDEFFGYGWGGGDEGQHEKLFLKLQEENEQFRQLYYSRQADLMNTVFSCENMLYTLDSMVAVIAPEMPRQIARWGGSMNEWEENVAELRGFIEERCTLLDDGMVDCFEVTGPYTLTLMTEPAGMGEIELNTLEFEEEELPWSGEYFGGMENLVKAKSTDDDYQFLYWVSSAGSIISPSGFSDNARIELTQNDTLTAYFGLPTSNDNIATDFSFNVFPNPTQDNLTLKYDLDKAMNVSVQLYSVVGQQVASFPLAGGKRSAGEHIEQLDLESQDISYGLYFLHIQADEQQLVRKVTVME